VPPRPRPPAPGRPPNPPPAPGRPANPPPAPVRPAPPERPPRSPVPVPPGRPGRLRSPGAPAWGEPGRVGIIPGDGRGPPGPPPPAGRGGTPPGEGRGPPAPGGASGRVCGRCIPVVPPAEYGLLPGRGPVGRRPIPVLSVPYGLLPGRGPPGRGTVGRGAAGPGFGPADAAAAAGRSGIGAGLGAVGGTSGAGATGCGSSIGAGAGDEAVPAGTFLAAVFAAALAGAAFFAGGATGASANASLNFRTTGASTVDDADRTNSPRSPNFARTTLLSTPNSLASSYTRTLATALLLGPGGGLGPARLCAYSSVHAHRMPTSVTSPCSG
jgi:hypothetical protein